MRSHPSAVTPIVVVAISVCLMAAVAPGAQAQVFVQGFDEVRDGPPNPRATLGIVTSPYYAAVRQSVTSRYGGAVVFGSPGWPDGASSITAEVLADSDVFVVTGTNLGLTPEEACLLNAFVEQGGAVLSFRNDWITPLILGTEPGSLGGRGRGYVVDSSSPIFSGPFGTVSSPVSVGVNMEYLRSGAGWPLLDDSGRVMMMGFGAETGHLGRAVIIGDEEIFLNSPVPFPGSTHGDRAGNQLLFANIIDYLINAPGLDADGVEALGVCTDQDGDGSNDLDDCDDSAAHVFPGAPELLDGVDNDCNGEVDENVDQDADGVPDLMDACPATPADSAVDHDGCAVTCQGVDSDEDGDGFGIVKDCNDQDPDIHPDAPELPGNRVDENCDGALACDPDAEWRNHGQFVSCVSRAVEQLVHSNRISVELGVWLVEQAAGSNTGRDGQGRSRR